LLGAAQARVNEVRITRLAESTFYAVASVEGPSGRADVDARPSDALNLALVSGAAIRIHSELLDDPQATRHTAWQQYAIASPQLVAEVRDRQADLLKLLAEQHHDDA